MQMRARREHVPAHAARWAYTSNSLFLKYDFVNTARQYLHNLCGMSTTNNKTKQKQKTSRRIYIHSL